MTPLNLMQKVMDVKGNYGNRSGRIGYLQNKTSRKALFFYIHLYGIRYSRLSFAREGPFDKLRPSALHFVLRLSVEGRLGVEDRPKGKVEP